VIKEPNEKHDLHVLTVGQDEPSFQNLNSTLSSDYGFQIRSVQTFTEGFTRMDQEQYDAVILNLDHRPESGWLAYIRLIHLRKPFLPVIALGDDESPAVGMHVISEGGDDYLVKGRIHSGVINRVVRYGIEKKRQNQRSYVVEQKYRLITERSATAICVLSPQETVLYVNPAAEVFFEISLGDVIGKPGREVLPFQDWDAVAAFLAAGEGVTKTLDTFFDKPGSKSSAALRLSSVRLEGDEEIFLFIDQKPVSLKEENERMIRSTKEAQQSELDRIQAEYISAVSHYLKTPLASIRLYLDYLVNGYAGVVTEKQKEYLTTIDETTERLNGQVTRLLNISKIRSQQTKLKMEQTDLAKLLEEESRIFRAQAEHKSLEMTVKTEKVPLLYCDRAHMREVIDNFISNAIKYTPAGKQVVFYSRGAADGVELVFEDTGIGIEPQYIDAIFDPFCDIPKTGIDWVESTGLGLSLTKRIVEMHQGSISIKSQKGQGSVFTVFLPLEKRKAAARRTP